MLREIYFILQYDPCFFKVYNQGRREVHPLSFTQNYFNPKLHLIRRHALPLGQSGSIFQPIDKKTWMAFLASLLSLLLSVFLVHHIFNIINPSFLSQSTDLVEITIRILAGFTEPDYIMPFKQVISGNSFVFLSDYFINLYRFNRQISSSTLVLGVLFHGYILWCRLQDVSYSRTL